MSELPQKVVGVLSAEPGEKSPLDTGLPDDSAALAVPRAASTPGSARETLTVEIDLAGERTLLEIHPNAVMRVVAHRYCAGGWKAVFELRDAINRSLGAVNAQALVPSSPLGTRPIGSLPPFSAEEKLALSRAVAFNKKTSEAISTLEMLVRAVLIQAAVDALSVARERVPQVRERFEAARERYKIKATEVDLGPTDIKPAVENAYRDRPEVHVEGSQAEARSLARAVKDLSLLHRDLVWVRSEVYGSSPGAEAPTPEAAGGSRGGEGPSPADEERVKKAEKAFLEFLKNPGGHTIAASVFALLKSQGQDRGRDRPPQTRKSLPARRSRRRSGRGHTSTSVTRSTCSRRCSQKETRTTLSKLSTNASASHSRRSPFHFRRTRSTRPSFAPPTGQPTERGTEDTSRSTTRQCSSVFWRWRWTRCALRRLAADSGVVSSPAVATLFTRRVLTELISARDTAARDLVLKEKAEGAFEETLNRVAGVLGVFGLLFPPARLASAGLGLFLLLGSAIATIIDVEKQQRVNQAFGSARCSTRTRRPTRDSHL